MDDLEDYFWRKPIEIVTFYNFRILGYVDMACVVLGILQFIFGMLVLTKKHLISPMNTIFIHYWGNLMMAGLFYMPRAYHELFRATLCAIAEHNTYTWETISYHSAILAATFRHFAVWMVLITGIWRFIAVIHPLKERHFCNMETTRKVIVVGYLLVFFGTSVPLYFATGVGPTVKSLDQNGCLTANFTAGKNVTIYEIQILLENYPFCFYLGMAMLATFVKLAPSCILTLISIWLIKTLIDAKKRRKKMLIISERENTYNKRIKRKIGQATDQTTMILLMILALFILGEVPHGIYSLFTAIYGPKFFWKYWYPALEALNSLTHVSEVFNFFIYYSMSREFRKTFRALFRFQTPQTFGTSLPHINNPKDNSTSGSSLSITTIC